MPATDAATEATEVWVEATEAARTFGVNRMTIARWADKGLVSVRSLPFCRRRYLLSDLARLVRGGVTPASRPAAEGGSGE